MGSVYVAQLTHSEPKSRFRIRKLSELEVTRGHSALQRFVTTVAKVSSSSTIAPSLMAESTVTLNLKEFQLHDKDTGSADMQVALLTRRIEHLTEHLKSNAKDHSSRRGLLKMVAQRRSLLDYLNRSQADRYKRLIEKLNLRK